MLQKCPHRQVYCLEKKKQQRIFTTVLSVFHALHSSSGKKKNITVLNAFMLQPALLSTIVCPYTDFRMHYGNRSTDINNKPRIRKNNESTDNISTKIQCIGHKLFNKNKSTVDRECDF